MFRRRRPTTQPAAADPLAGFAPRWRGAVAEALASRDRLHVLVAQAAPGPLQDRLAAMVQRAETALQASWNIAGRAQTAEGLIATMDRERVQDQLKDARRRLASAPVGSQQADQLAAEVALLADQHAALNQIANTVEDAEGQLRMLDLRLDAVVARAAHLVLRPDAVDELSAVEGQLDTAIEELNALGAGFDAVAALGG